jgi:hypothetical protein
MKGAGVPELIERSANFDADVCELLRAGSMRGPSVRAGPLRSITSYVVEGSTYSCGITSKCLITTGFILSGAHFGVSC